MARLRTNPTFTLEEIRNYLNRYTLVRCALKDLSEEAMLNANPIDTTKQFIKNDETLKLYEHQIGMSHAIEHQLRIRRNTGGASGKKWSALSPKWIEGRDKFKEKTDYLIYYWVNYGDGITYGRFTVEQIYKWLTTKELKLIQLGGTNETTTFNF